MSAFLDVLRSGRVLLMDGAMGTELQRAGIRDDECLEAWNLTHAEKVLSIHRSYVQAGAEVLLSNTFQANPSALARHGMANSLHEIIQAGIVLARRAVPEGGFVLADIGPTASFEPNLFRSVGAALASADGVLLETFSDPKQASSIVALHREGDQADLPVLVSFTFGRSRLGAGLETFKGIAPKDCARSARTMGVAALGVNCGRDLDLADYLEILHAYRGETDLPLFVRPNAGTPTLEKGRRVYPREANHFAGWLPALGAAGVSMIGGCCGTTPESIDAMRSSMFGRAPA